MKQNLVETGPMPSIDTSTGPSTTPVSIYEMAEEYTYGVEDTASHNMAQELSYAWSEGDDPMPQSYEALSDDEKQAYKRILRYDPASGDVIVGPIDESHLEDLERKIEQAPNFESAINIIDELHDTNPLHVVTLLEKVAHHYGNSEAATERIDEIIEHTTEVAQLAITGQHETASPQAGVEGLVKAYNVARSPEVKKHIRTKLETAVKAATAYGEHTTQYDAYALDPQIAESALEVVADLKHVSPREEVDAEVLLQAHAEEDLLRQEVEDLEQLMAVKRTQIENLRRLRAQEMQGKTTIIGAATNLLRFGR